MENMRKDLECILEKTKSLAMKIKDYDCSKMTSGDFMEAFDLMKDTAMTMSYLSKAKYYDTVTEAMEENADEYGLTWDENGKYKMKVADWYSGSEEMRQKDHKKGIHYYTEMSDLERYMKKYEEMHDLESLEHMLNAINAKILEYMPMMDVNHKNMTKTKLTTTVNMIK